MVNLREELQSKLHCPKNKKFNQLEIENYNLEEQILNADEIFKMMKYQIMIVYVFLVNIVNIVVNQKLAIAQH